MIQGSSANARDHFGVIFPEIIQIQGWGNPHKGLKAKKRPSLTAQKPSRGGGGVEGTRQLNGLSRNYKRLLKVENLPYVKLIMYRQ